MTSIVDRVVGLGKSSIFYKCVQNSARHGRRGSYDDRQRDWRLGRQDLGWTPAALIIAAPAIAGFHQVPLWIAFTANLSYAIPAAVCLRLLHRRVLQRFESVALFGLGWLLGIVVVYQLITSPVVWLVRGMLNDTLSLAFVLDVYRTQPFLFESLATGVVAALIATVFRLYDQLASRERRLSTILQSIGDGVIVTDADGRIELMNRAAQSLTGYEETEARAAQLESVFVIVSSTDHSRRENPLRRVLAEGTVVGLANHTSLIARDGTEHPIADSAAPVKEPGQPPSGAVLVFRDVSSEYALQRRLEHKLRENEMLLHEVNHRVRNNLQIMSSMLSLQAQYVSDPREKSALQSTRRRIQAMSLIHTQLHDSHRTIGVDLESYIMQVARHIAIAVGWDRDISIDTEIEDLDITVDSGVAWGLVLNELIANSLAHGFDECEDARIRISARRVSGGGFELRYSDNGRGLDAKVDPQTATSLGFFLVRALTAQLGYRFEVNRTSGLSFRFIAEQ